MESSSLRRRRSAEVESDSVKSSGIKDSRLSPGLSGLDTGQNRKRARDAEDSRSESEDGQDSGFPVREGYWPRRVKPGTIKACNECRQQKLRCDVVKDPFLACSRCRRLGLECKIDSSFKRVGKRNKYEEMRKEIELLKVQLANEAAKNRAMSASLQQGDSVYPSPGSNTTLTPQRLEDIALSGDRLASLFHQFFTFFHPFLPLLDPEMTSDHYFSLSPLLGWTIVLVASRRSSHEPTLMAALSGAYTKLLWATLGEQPQSYHVVKALALICTWPLPINSSSIDPSFMISGIMMQIALQNGLHRPSHAQDFGKYVKDVNEREAKDRALTWALCNIVVQNASSGYGQPSMSIYDFTLGLGLVTSNAYELPSELQHQLRIAKFCDKVTKTLYSNPSDPIGLISEKEQATIMSILRVEYQELEMSVTNSRSSINKIYLLAALHHLHCFAFFIPRTNPSQQQSSPIFIMRQQPSSKPA